jgi:DNA-binding HxlR family transcriptional regulator
MGKERNSAARRSCCPISCALDVLGDKWTLLILRDLCLGKRRFKEFASSPEKIPSNLLTERLERLVSAGIVEKCESTDGTKHLSYRLTEKGEAIRPTLKALKDWSLHWIKGTKVMLSPTSESPR